MAQGYFFCGHCTLITTGINKCCIYIENKKNSSGLFSFLQYFLLSFKLTFCVLFFFKQIFVFCFEFVFIAFACNTKSFEIAFLFFLPSAIFGQTGKSCLCFSSIALGAGDQYRLISICHKLSCHVLQRSTVAMDLGQHVKCSSSVTKNISPPPIY